MQYAEHILNRSATWENAKRASPIEVLTGKVPDPRGTVGSRSPCSVCSNPSKDFLQQRSQRGIIVVVREEKKVY